jgi:hypothetical protein
MAEEKGMKVKLKVNGKPVALNPYVESVFANVLKGLVGTLKNTPVPERIEVIVAK